MDLAGERESSIWHQQITIPTAGRRALGPRVRPEESFGQVLLQLRVVIDERAHRRVLRREGDVGIRSTPPSPPKKATTASEKAATGTSYSSLPRSREISSRTWARGRRDTRERGGRGRDVSTAWASAHRKEETVCRATARRRPASYLVRDPQRVLGLVRYLAIVLHSNVHVVPVTTRVRTTHPANLDRLDGPPRLVGYRERRRNPGGLGNARVLVGGPGQLVGHIEVLVR
eukprot:scaffold5363_cov109-Isochrysis_galbana.AAC.3